jgi:uncharacterized membrane protein
MGNAYPGVKSPHVVCVIGWFAGLLDLPRTCLRATRRSCARVAASFTPFADGPSRRTHGWLRWRNEAPAVSLVAIVVLVVVKPF